MIQIASGHLFFRYVLSLKSRWGFQQWVSSPDFDLGIWLMVISNKASKYTHHLLFFLSYINTLKDKKKLPVLKCTSCHLSLDRKFRRTLFYDHRHSTLLQRIIVFRTISFSKYFPHKRIYLFFKKIFKNTYK